jgi:hypothetical protein
MDSTLFATSATDTFGPTNAIPLEIPESSPGRSGGPRTPEGKAQSRRNSSKYGLRAKVVFPDELAALIDQRHLELRAQFLPSTSYEDVMVWDMAFNSAQIERCAALGVIDLERVIDRAEKVWDLDRRDEVEDLGARLAVDPARVAQRLSKTRQGADWLISRWVALGGLVREFGHLQESQRQLAFDMLGVAPILRSGTPLVPAADDAPGLLRLIDREIERLRTSQVLHLNALDTAAREMVLAGTPLVEDKHTARLRR